MIYFFLGGRKGRRYPPYGVRTANAVDIEAKREAPIRERFDQGMPRFPRRSIGNNLHAEKKATAANISYGFVTVLEFTEAILQVSADDGGMVGKFPAEDRFHYGETDDPLFAPFGGCHDVMGDGSMTLLPTPGHTPGSMSMLVQTGGIPPLLMVGDLTYEVDLLMKDQVPGTGDKARLRSSFAKVRALKEAMPDLIILPAHDPAAAEALRVAT